jgi:hypothetical protein
LYQGDLQGTLDRRAAVEQALSNAASLDLLRKQYPNLHLAVNVLADPCRRCEKAADLLAQVVPDDADSGTGIDYLGDRQYKPSNRTNPQTLTEREDNVLQAFLGHTSMDLATLKELSGEQDAARILKRLTRNYGGAFAPSIRLPGGKGKGGYSVQVNDKRPR